VEGAASPSPPIVGLGSDCKCILDGLRAQEMRLVAANDILLWQIDACLTTCTVCKLLKKAWLG